MRKALSRDVHKKSVIPLQHPVPAHDVWQELYPPRGDEEACLLALLYFLFGDDAYDPYFYEILGSRLATFVVFCLSFLVLFAGVALYLFQQ